MKNLALNKSDVTDVAVTNVETIELNTDASPYARLGWLFVIIGFGGFLLWAMIAPLDQGVPMSGNVAVATNRKVIQYQTGGTVDNILVKDGDQVKAGQVLLKMNSIQVKSALDIAKTQFYTAKATEARLVAERENRNDIVFPPSLLEAKAIPQVANNLMLQQQLFSSRRMSLQSEMGAADETVAGLNFQLTGLEESMQSKKQQQVFLKEQLDSVRELSKDGYVARNRLLDLERTYAQVNGSISEDIGNIGRVKRQIAELTLRKSQRQQDYQKEVRTVLSDIQKESEALQSRLMALEYDFKNVDVKAPVDGTIVGMNVFTVGAVVPAGFKLMELVPVGDALIIEGQLPVNLVDKVHKGLPVELIFSAFNTNKTPHIPGTVMHVSADRTVDERTGMPYYKVRAEVAPEGVKKLANLQVRPGMPVDMVVKTGERTMMNYLLRPLLDRAATALKEE
jgi:protease secretion system membrane fusion protein